jgi:hypothetical protein
VVAASSIALHPDSYHAETTILKHPVQTKSWKLTWWSLGTYSPRPSLRPPHNPGKKERERERARMLACAVHKQTAEMEGLSNDRNRKHVAVYILACDANNSLFIRLLWSMCSLIVPIFVLTTHVRGCNHLTCYYCFRIVKKHGIYLSSQGYWQ